MSVRSTTSSPLNRTRLRTLPGRSFTSGAPSVYQATGRVSSVDAADRLEGARLVLQPAQPQGPAVDGGDEVAGLHAEDERRARHASSPRA